MIAAVGRARAIEPNALSGKVAERAAERPGLLLVLDYDGTLARIAPTPDGARLKPDAARVLERLAATPGTVVAVVSGRTLADLALVLPPIAGLFRFGTHGVEGRAPDGAAIGAVASVGAPPGLRALVERAAREAWPPGAFVEDKGVVVTLHYRLASAADAARACGRFLALARECADHSGVDVLRGRQVIEVRTAGVDKGVAVRWLRGRAGPPEPLVVVVGDDVTDEDGFAAVGASGYAVLVSESDRPTRARWRLRDPDEVLRFLEGLASGAGAGREGP